MIDGNRSVAVYSKGTLVLKKPWETVKRSYDNPQVIEDALETSGQYEAIINGISTRFVLR